MLFSANKLMTSVLALVLFTLGLYAMDLFIYPGFVENRLGFSTQYLYIPSVLALFIYRFVLRQTFPDTIQKIALLVIPATVATCVGIQIIHPIVHANFFFNTFHIHPPQLEQIALYLSGISISLFSPSFISQYRQLFTFIIPFWVLSLAVYFKWNFPNVFWFIEKEDSLTEYLTFGTYLLVAYVAYKCLRTIFRTNKLQPTWKKFYATLFVLIIATSIVIAGEEISWGQRILGFDTPETVAANNTQSEFNIHNQSVVFQYVYTAYALLGLFGATAWLIVKLISKTGLPTKVVDTIRFLSPSWRLVGFFIPIIVYAYLRERFGDAMFDQWEELMELYLALGILFFIIDKFNELRRKKLAVSPSGNKKNSSSK